MFKKTIEFENFNGEKVVKDFYFHLTKAELLLLGVSNLEDRLQRIINAKDYSAIMAEFKDLITLAVGIRSEDGNLFIKDENAKNNLIFSPAYDVLTMELCTDAQAGAEFVQNLLPPKLREEMKKELSVLAEQKTDPFAEPKDERPAWIREHREPTDAELRSMSPEQLREIYIRKAKQLGGA